jgi:hypothetical protein
MRFSGKIFILSVHSAISWLNLAFGSSYAQEFAQGDDRKTLSWAVQAQGGLFFRGDGTSAEDLKRKLTAVFGADGEAFLRHCGEPISLILYKAQLSFVLNLFGQEVLK